MFPNLKWVFPCSKVRPSVRFGSDMRQWFDIWSVESPEKRIELQIPGLRESAEAILEIIKKEALEVPLNQIIQAGISQGCATALCTLFHGNVQLSDFIGLCGWLPYGPGFSERVEVVGKEAALKTPAFLSHAMDDTVVPVANGEALRDGLKQLKMGVEWRCYEDGGHWLNEPKGVDDVVAFIDRCCRDGSQG